MFGIFSGTEIPTKQDKFKSVTVSILNEDREEFLHQLYDKVDITTLKSESWDNLIQDAADRIGVFFEKKKHIKVILQFYIGDKRNLKGKDVDNLSKQVLDLLEGKFFTSDSQVYILVANKIWGRSKNGLFVRIEEIEEDRSVMDMIAPPGVRVKRAGDPPG